MKDPLRTSTWANLLFEWKEKATELHFLELITVPLFFGGGGVGHFYSKELNEFLTIRSTAITGMVLCCATRNCIFMQFLGLAADRLYPNGRLLGVKLIVTTSILEGVYFEFVINQWTCNIYLATILEKNVDHY